MKPIYLLLGAILSAVLPLFLLLMSDNIKFNASVVLCVVIIFYSSSRLVYLTASGQKLVATIVFWIFVYLFLGITPLLQYSNPSLKLYNSYDILTIVRTEFVVIIGILSFDFAQLISRKTGTKFKIWKILLRPIYKKNIVLFGFLAILISGYIVIKLGGTSYLISTRMEINMYMLDLYPSHETHLIKMLNTIPIFIFSISAFGVLIAYRNSQIPVGLPWKTMTFIFLTVTVVVNNPIATPRFMVGTIVLSCFFILPWKRDYGMILVAVLISGMIIIFPLADLYRYSLEASISDRLFDSSIIFNITTKGDFDAFQQIANTILTVEKEGLQFGRQIMGALLFWVPRSLWVGKPLSTGMFVSESVGYQYTNRSAPLWAEFYVDGGMPLVVIGFFLYGFLVYRLDQLNRFYYEPGRLRLISIFLPIFSAYQIFLLRGALMPAFAYFAPMPVFMLLCTIRMKN